jgi:hypothetical protein
VVVTFEVAFSDISISLIIFWASSIDWTESTSGIPVRFKVSVVAAARKPGRLSSRNPTAAASPKESSARSNAGESVPNPATTFNSAVKSSLNKLLRSEFLVNKILNAF